MTTSFSDQLELASRPFDQGRYGLVIDEEAYDIPVSASKSMRGHTIGASGAIEAAVSALTIRDNLIHPTINYRTTDPDCDLDYVPNEARNTAVDVVMSNSRGWVDRT